MSRPTASRAHSSEALTEAPTLVLPAADPGTDAAPSTVDGRVLAGEEKRTRMGALRGLFIVLLVLTAGILFMPNKTGLTWALIALYTISATAVAVLIAMSRKRQYSSGVSTVIGVVVVLLVLGSCLYFGVIGGPIIIMPTVVYHYGLGDSKPRRRWVVGVALSGHFLLTLLAFVGVVPPTGMIPPSALLRGDYILLTGFSIGALLAAAYWISSISRRSTLLAMAELERARRGIRRRDALLDEAREDLDRVVAVARAGRLTGRDIDGYQLGNVIGRGSMGEVYQATEEGSGQEVAFKAMLPHLSDSRGQVARYFREAEIIAALESPHIPKLLASGMYEEGTAYLVLELLHGRDLAADLRQRKSLSLSDIDALVEQVSLALHAAHDAGVVHRDIKPQNLFLVAKPRANWKVLDFGVSMIAGGSGTLTQGAGIGTPAYMAPEQALGASVDRRADVFSLGAVVYRALTGRPAFSGTSNAATLYAALHFQPIRPGELVDVDPDVDAVLALSLAKKDNLRLGSARDFASAWASARHHLLSAELRTAAERLVAAHPWGTDYTKSSRLSGP